MLLFGNNRGPNNCMPNAPNGAVNKMDITAIVTSRVEHSTSSGVPKFLAMSRATGAKAAYTTRKNNFQLKYAQGRDNDFLYFINMACYPHFLSLSTQLIIYVIYVQNFHHNFVISNTEVNWSLTKFINETIICLCSVGQCRYYFWNTDFVKRYNYFYNI